MTFDNLFDILDDEEPQQSVAVIEDKTYIPGDTVEIVGRLKERFIDAGTMSICNILLQVDGCDKIVWVKQDLNHSFMPMDYRDFSDPFLFKLSVHNLTIKIDIVTDDYIYASLQSYGSLESIL